LNTFSTASSILGGAGYSLTYSWKTIGGDYPAYMLYHPESEFDSIFYTFPFVLTVAGTIMQSLSYNLEKWQEYRFDKNNVHTLQKPSYSEYGYATLAGVSESLSWSGHAFLFSDKIIEVNFNEKSVSHVRKAISHVGAGVAYGMSRFFQKKSKIFRKERIDSVMNNKIA